MNDKRLNEILLDNEELRRIKALLGRLHKTMDGDLRPSTTTIDRVIIRINKQLTRNSKEMYSTTQDPQRPECPKCGSGRTEPADEGFFKCRQCGTEFDPSSQFDGINY